MDAASNQACRRSTRRTAAFRHERMIPCNGSKPRRRPAHAAVRAPPQRPFFLFLSLFSHDFFHLLAWSSAPGCFRKLSTMPSNMKNAVPSCGATLLKIWTQTGRWSRHEHPPHTGEAENGRAGGTLHLNECVCRANPNKKGGNDKNGWMDGVGWSDRRRPIFVPRGCCSALR